MAKVISISICLCFVWIQVLINGERVRENPYSTESIPVSSKYSFENMKGTTELPVNVESAGNQLESEEITSSVYTTTDDFEGIESTEQTLEDFEKNLRDTISNMFSKAFPYFTKMNVKVTASTGCLLSFLKLYTGIKNLEPWAFKILDASGKLPPGLLEGTSTALGDYDECINTLYGRPHKRTQTAKYCLLEVEPPETVIDAIKEYQTSKQKSNSSLGVSKSFLSILRQVRSNPNHIMFRMGICMSPKCSHRDVQDLVNIASTNLDISIKVARCEAKEKYEFKIHEVIILIFLANIVALTLLGTFADICFSSGCCSGKCRPVEAGQSTMNSENKCRVAKFLEILRDFSLCHNTRMLLDNSEEEDALDVIRGIKVFTVILAIFGHTYALPHPLHLYRFSDSLNFSHFIDEVLFGIVANASVGVDTFFFIAGFVFIYYRWRLMNKPPIGRYILTFLYVNYTRMLAFQIFVVFFFALFPIIGSGPLWQEFVEEPLQNCARKWWMNLLLIQNFLGPYDSCLYHSWILATMMQLFLLTAIIVWIMHKKPLVGISLNVLVITLAAIAVAFVTIVLDFPATFTMYFYDYRTSIQYWNYLYVQSYNHLGPFCIGMLTAYCIAEYPVQKMKKLIVIFLWAASISTCGAIIFGLFCYREDQNMDRTLAVFYAALHRPAWGLATGWMVYACATSNGGFINRILSWKGLIPLERLCYLAFFLHVPLMYFHGGIQRERMYMGHYSQVMTFFSYVTASFLLSSVCYLFFQAPYQTIESYLFGKHNDNIWQVSSASTSTETLKTVEAYRRNEASSKVLFNRKL